MQLTVTNCAIRRLVNDSKSKLTCRSKGKRGCLPEIRREHVDDYAIDQRDAERRQRLEHAGQYQVLRRIDHKIEGDCHGAGYQ